jgi:hypothetical protein
VPGLAGMAPRGAWALSLTSATGLVRSTLRSWRDGSGVLLAITPAGLRVRPAIVCHGQVPWAPSVESMSPCRSAIATAASDR